jgi:uncharacterized membrane protein
MIIPKHNLRLILKAISFRFFATIDTILLSYLVTQSWENSLHIGGLELITKIILYFLHDILWERYRPVSLSDNTIHIIKSISWRIVGTLDTITLAWIVTGNPMNGLKIGFLEVTTKMILYYLHEKLWARIPEFK